ncbi:MAG: T9SS type A sorting domain-containing protein [Saprospiraceae bacterium]|nr:T9SS type A sorting domain-containing protein [Saprospiraceae bacterium]
MNKSLNLRLLCAILVIQFGIPRAFTQLTADDWVTKGEVFLSMQVYHHTLGGAPSHSEVPVGLSEKVIALPISQTKVAAFRVARLDTDQKGSLSNQFLLSGYKEPWLTGLLTLSEHGINAQFSTTEGTLRISPSSLNDGNTHALFYSSQSGPDYVLKFSSEATWANEDIEARKNAWGNYVTQHPYYTRENKNKKAIKATTAKKDRPDLAMEQEVLMTMDPALGYVPWDRRIAANEAMADELSIRGPIAGVNWNEKGPNNVGGRTRAIVFDPNDGTNKKVWAGGVGGGLWYTNDITVTNPTWVHVDGFWDNIAISSIAFNPANTQEIYVGTGEGWFNGDAQRGGGIWKSTNGGTTWSLLAATNPGAYNSSSHFHYVQRIVIKADGTIFAATRGYFSNTGGIMRSTNGGTTWTNVLTNPAGNDFATDIEIAANGDLFASFGVFTTGSVHKSTNANNGASGTWTDLSSAVGIAAANRIELACAPSNANIIYAVAYGGSGDLDVEWFKKSIDGGTTWTSITIPLMVDGSGNHFTRGQAWYDLILAVHPTDPNLVLTGGIDLHRTTNGGTSWTGISHWYGGFSKPYVHADQHGMTFRPGNNSQVLFSHDGGITLSTNAGDGTVTPTFADKNSGYNVTQFYACATKNEVNSHYFLAGAQDNGSQKFSDPGIGQTVEATGGDGAFCHIDQLNADIQTTAYITNVVYRSLNGGNSFTEILNENSGHFINPSEYDSDRKIFYSAANNDELKRLSNFNAAINNQTLTISVGSAKVSALKISPYNDVLFLGIANGRVYKYTNASSGSPTLTRIDNGATPISATGWVSSIDVGADDNHIMVTYSNYGVISVWETVDGGNVWRNKEGNLPDMPIRWALYNPENRNEVLVATELGVWSTDNFQPGTAGVPVWGASNTSLAHTRVTMLKYREVDKMVVASTHGRGLFTSDIFVDTTIVDFGATPRFTCSGSLTVQFSDASIGANNSWAWDIDNNGSTNYTTKNPSHTYSSQGAYSVKLTIDGGTVDTVKNNLILVLSSGPIANAGCVVSANINNGNGAGIGIFRFVLNNLNHISSHNNGSYHDLTCTAGTALTLNTTYSMTISTGLFNNEGARVYIDYNNDGVFAAGEAVGDFPANTEGTRSINFTTPSSGVTMNTGLRLRVLSKFAGVPTSPCDVGNYGQAEDYTVFFAQPAPPEISIAALDAVKNEGNVGNTAFTFRATRTGDTGGTSSVNYAVTGSGGNPANTADFGGSFPAGTVNFAAGETIKDITVNVSGDLVVEPNEGFTVTISNPVNATIGTATATGTIQNDDIACPTVSQVFINEFHYDNVGTDVGEFVEVAVANAWGGNISDITLTLYNGSGGVSYGTHLLSTFTTGANDGTYTYYHKLIVGIQNGAPDGFSLHCQSNAAFQFISYEGVMVATNGAANGQTSTDIGASQNGTDEPAGSSIQLVSGTWYSICGQNTQGAQNARPTLVIAANDAVKNEGNAGNTAFTFTVTRSGLTTGATTANYAVTGSGGNPANAADFGGTLPSGTVSFAAAETTKSITINVSGDLVVEPDEGFTVTLTAAGNCYVNLATPSANGTILNDDVLPLPVISIAATDAVKNEGNAGNTAFTFTATRTGDLSAASSVSWAVTGSGGTPANAADFGGVLPSGTANFAINVASQMITVNVSGDLVVESDEGFTVTISNPVNATIGTATATGTILNDDVAVSCPTVSQVFINEFHYDNSGADVGEFVEVAVANAWGGNVSDITLTLYNGAGGASYDTHVLSTFTIGANDGTYTYYHKLISGIQNGSPDGFSLHCQSNAAFQFISYEGVIVATNGPANGQTSTDIGASQNGTDEPAGSSIQLVSGTWYSICGQNTQGAQNARPTLVIAANDAVKNEGNAGNTAFTFTVTRSGLTTGATTANYAVTGSGGNPANAADFGGTLPSGTVSFAAAETTKSLTINVSGDLDFESDEGFTVTLSAAGNCYVNLATPAASGTILNDDSPAYTISISDPCSCNNDATPNNQDGTFGEEVTIMGPANLNLVVGNGSVGLIGIAVGDPIPEVPAGSGTYIIQFDHLDAIGYTLELAEDDPANLLGVSITNTCYYPIAAINGLANMFCEGDPSVSLSGSAELGNGGGPANGIGEFFVDGVGPVTTFDPATPGVYTIRFEFDAADNDPNPSHPGCISIVAQDVTVNDSPVLTETHVDVTCPVGNDGSIDISVTGGTAPLTFDWADLPGTNNGEDRTGLSAGLYAVTVTDDNGCSDNLSVTILDGVDGIDPDITCPDDITIECDDSTDPADTGMASATDDCDPDPVITYTDVEDLTSCGGTTGTITRTWRAEDASGNFVECDQIITVNDTTPPVWITTPLPQDVTVECDAIPVAADLEASDNCVGGAGGNVIFINELHYDNTGADVNEFVEVAGTAGLDLTGYSIVWYNGSNGTTYGTTNLSGVIDDEGNMTGARSFTFVGIQNGSPDALALVDPANNVLQFLSYEGAFMATNGPAIGMMSVDIGVAENGAEPVGNSLQLTGTGSDYTDFVWNSPAPESPGSLNTNQTLDAPAGGPVVNVVFNQVLTPGACTDSYTITRTWTATDACNNAITHTQEITVEDTTDPTWTSNLPGDVSVECDMVPAAAVLTADDNCDLNVTVSFDEDRADGNCPHNYVLTRIWTATDNCNNAITHTQTITVSDTTPPVWDQNPLPQDVTVACNMVPDAPVLTATDNCTDGGMGADVLFINEIHYDNTGGDVNEFIEIAGAAGLNLTGYSLVLYNGSNGLVYNTLPLTGTIPNEGNGTGALAFVYPVNGIQNGSPDGIALVQGANVLYFLSYEGAFLAVDGPAAGIMSVDIGVAENGAEPIGQSLQLIGTGTDYPNFTWTGPLAESPGLLNVNQDFTLPVPTEIVYTFNENFAQGACLGEGVYTRTWTATDACNNTITHTQTITVIDDIPPVFNEIPQDLTVECDAIPSPLTVEAVDGCGPVAGIRPWINEIHYDNVGVDVNEFFEIAGPAGIDLGSYTIYLYNGANGLLYGNNPLSGVIPDEGTGYGALAFFLPVNGIQNGSPDGIALYQGATLIQFLSYEGAFVAVDGPAAGQGSVNIGVAQEPAPAIGLSLQLAGTGNQYNQFTWTGPVDDSPGLLNSEQLAGPVEVPVVLTENIIPGNCIGRQTIIRTFRATDDCGNTATVTQTITVVDTTPPVAQCKDANLFLDDNGLAVLNPADIDNGSTDNCSPVLLSLSKTTFTCSDKGMQNVTLTVSDDCGNSAACVAVVTVLDLIPPTITCPPSRIINLDPGLCCAIVSWAEPTVTDNCPFVGPVTGLFTANAGAPGNFFNAFAGVTFDVRNDGAQPLTISSWDIPVTGTLGNNLVVNVYYTTVATTNVGVQTNPAAWTLLGSANVPLSVNATPWNPATLINIPVGGLTLNPGQSKGIYVVITNYPSGTLRYTNGNFSQTDGTLSILSNGFAGAVNFGNTFASRAFVGRVNYQTGGEPDIIQTGGPISGTELCKDDSPWEVSYRVEDSSGNEAECSFTISVLEYAFPISNLQCNDNVQVSLDEDCNTPIGADMILEGGPYGCYDDYVVMVFNAQNQVLPTSPFVGRQQIGGTFKVKVTDPETGNSCWGQISVEDKRPPVMECRDIVVDCGADIPLEPAPALTGPQSIIYSGINEPIGEAGAPVPDIHEYSFDFSYLPAGTPVQDVDIRVKLTGHTWLPDLDIRVISPNGTESDIFSLTGCTGTEWPIDVIFDDQGQNNLTQCAELNAAGARLQPILAPGQSGIALDVFNGEDASGIWRIRFADNVGLDDGVIEIAGVILTADVPAVPVTDNCDPVITLGDGLDYGDDLFNYTCAQDADYSQLIVRTWTAVDDWGNSTQCTQEIRVRRPTITSVILPHNYDDLDLASFNCKSEYPLPDVTGQPDGAGCGSLQFAYEDKVLEICQGSYTILRTWTLHDMCTNDISSHTQVIKVTDKTAPVLTCPDIHDIKIGATKKIGYQECTAEVQMPWIQVTDDCSTTNNLTFYVWTTLADGSIVIVNTMNAEGYFIFDLPVGRTYTFTYTAIDHCGNKAECTIPVLVNDNVPPVVICETLHIVALSDSVTLVNAVSFDDGSYDGCSNVIFDARRGTMNSSGAFVQHPCNLPGDLLYAPQVRFYCCDGLSNVPLFVDLRVRDAFGNANNCMVEVQVVDKVRPVIWCPDDITVQCGMPFTPTETDTFEICAQPGIPIKAAYAATYTVPIDIFGIPADAKITDLDLKLDIDHDLVNQLQITLYSPLNRKATVLTKNGCVGQPVQYPWGIDVLFNDQAYDINIFNSTNQKVAALFACTTAKPSIGAYNQGHMKPQGDELKVFNGQPLNSFTDKNLCFTAGQNDIDAVTNRMSNFSVQQFILQAGLVTGDRILLEYSNATGAELTGIHVGSIYLFQVINNNTIEFLTITGSDITSVPAGSAHMFCASGTWLLVVEDTAPLAGGLINEVCLSIEYALPLGLKPHVTDNAQECGLDVSYQDLATPDKCADGTFINRRWRVDDAFGNNTSCIQRVYFIDNSPLTVQFPCDVTIQCQDLEDLAETGDVRHNGDCELVGIEHIDHTLVTTDACFKILRTWIVKDWCQYQDDGTVDYPTTNINDVTEEITFTTAINALITARKIDIGDRVTLRYVTSGSVEIPGLVEGDVYSVIRVSGTTFRFDYNTTKQQSVNITGQGTGPHIFRFANSERGLPVTCDVLEEWYPFTEWYTGCCNPAAERRAWENDGDGYFKFTQEIKVVDNTAPQWVDCADREFCSFEENCEPTLVELIYQATDNCTDTSQLSYSYFIDLFNDGTVDISGVGNDASGAYPNGTHQIVFKVTDQCGNWNTCTSLFTIRDCKKPTPICINGLSVDLMPSTGFVEVWASSFEAGDSYDNCTEYEKLTIKIERLDAVDPGQTAPDADAGDTVKVSCQDMPPNAPLPIVKVAIWVGDEAGNWDYCVTELWVQDWMGPCAATMNTELVAYVANEDQEPVEKVAIDLTGSMNMPALITGSGGNVSFGTVPVEGQYTVTPQKDIQPLNGVSTYDLLLIQKHLLGIKSISSTYKLIAADANNSCSVSISDIIELRKMILTPGLNFKDNTSWRFVEANYVFPNPSKPCDFPEVKNFNNLNPGMTSANFIGVKIGDVSGDAVPNSLLGADTRNSVGVLAFAIADQVLVGGEEYTIAITADHFQGVQGYQYTIDFDASVVSFDRVDAVWTELSSSNFGTARVNEGLLTTSWNGSEAITLADGEVLFTVTFRAKANVKLSQVLKVNSRVTAAEAYDAREDLLDVKFRYNGDLVVGGQFELYQNEPNPFRDVTIIGFNLPEASRATLKVYDVTGKVVKVVRGDFAKGYNSINLDRTDIHGNGMLYYQLDTPTDSATKRMILID